MKIFGTILPYMGFGVEKLFPDDDKDSRIEMAARKLCAEAGRNYEDIVLIELNTFEVAWLGWKLPFYYSMATYFKKDNK